MKATEILTVAISSMALVISILTWLALVRRGKVQMTRPNIIVFTYEDWKPKIFLRCLLFSTARRGNIVENMYLIFSQNNQRRLFGSWAYGEHQDLVRGSGLFVGTEGVAVDHHFVAEGTDRLNPAGECKISVYASTLGDKQDRLLYNMHLEISESESKAIVQQMNLTNGSSVYDWNPEHKEYRPH